MTGSFGLATNLVHPRFTAAAVAAVAAVTVVERSSAPPSPH